VNDGTDEGMLATSATQMTKRPRYGEPCGVCLAYAGLICVLPSGHPGCHASERGLAWGKLRPASWAYEGEADGDCH
jgi:hypothetical protein